MHKQSPTNTSYSLPYRGGLGRGPWGWVLLLLLSILLQSCRHDIIVWPSEEEEVGETRQDSILGFYLLNEGNMGSNKCTMDFYDYATGTYTRNVYGNANPSAVKELGDVGNDLRIYGSRMWAVINCSNKIEVMEARTARRVGQVNLANCRYIAFHEGYAYVSSYAGPVQINPDYEQKGIVVKIDTATLEKVDTCIVGFQPDRLDITGGKIYVANSGGYMFPNYENTVSVIDLATFREEKRIPVAVTSITSLPMPVARCGYPRVETTMAMPVPSSASPILPERHKSAASPPPTVPTSWWRT